MKLVYRKRIVDVYKWHGLTTLDGTGLSTLTAGDVAVFINLVKSSFDVTNGKRHIHVHVKEKNAISDEVKSEIKSVTKSDVKSESIN